MATKTAMGPKLKKIASLVGLRADAKDVIDYVTNTLKKKVPEKTTSQNDSANVSAPKLGVELCFTHDVKNEAYAPIALQRKGSFLPYLSLVWLNEKLGEDVLGVPWSAKEADVTKILGKPTGKRSQFAGDEPTQSYWTHVVDAKKGVEIDLYVSENHGLKPTIQLRQARNLEQFVDPSTCLFVGWAAANGLLDGSRFKEHKALFDQVKKKKAQGSELVKAAMPRGLWDDHLIAKDDLRELAYCWFHNIGDHCITADLIKVFGKREGKFGHDEPKLDDDAWDAVDRASKIFGQRFAKWL